MDEMIVRIRNLGGKNISEPDKKLVTAAWLHICGFGENAQRRAIMKLKFKTRFDTLMRGFTPKVYMTKLLPVEEVKRSIRPCLTALTQTPILRYGCRKNISWVS